VVENAYFLANTMAAVGWSGTITEAIGRMEPFFATLKVGKAGNATRQSSLQDSAMIAMEPEPEKMPRLARNQSQW